MTDPGDDSTTDDAATSVEGISDEQLPDDLTPGDDNPLAEGLDDGESVGDLLEDGKPAEQDAPDRDDDGDPTSSQG